MIQRKNKPLSLRNGGLKGGSFLKYRHFYSIQVFSQKDQLALKSIIISYIRKGDYPTDNVTDITDL